MLIRVNFSYVLTAAYLFLWHLSEVHPYELGSLILKNVEENETGASLMLKSLNKSPRLKPKPAGEILSIFCRKNPSSPQQLWNGDLNSLKSSNFDSSKKTLVLIHGYMNGLNDDIIQTIKNNILAVEDCNVIGVDWSLLTTTVFYHIVALETPSVGRFIGGFVSFLSNNGLDLKKTHLIGHSLGAQAAGFAGKQLNGELSRISGLEPALPGFIETDKSSRLDAGDANFVDCIHTCSGMLGFKDPICDADFYPNGGLDPQPGCTWLDFGACSHARSHQLYAESIQKGHLFYALTCPTIPTASPVNCEDKGALMGYVATPEYKGMFYTSTNAEYPFSKNVSQS